MKLTIDSETQRERARREAIAHQMYRLIVAAHQPIVIRNGLGARERRAELRRQKRARLEALKQLRRLQKLYPEIAHLRRGD